MIKTMKALALAAVLLCAALGLAACGGEPQETAPAGDITYTVTVTDELGTPYTSGVIVRFLRGEEQAAMQPVDANGIAAKTLAAGDYTVELMFTGDESEYHYEKEGLILTAAAPELQVKLSYHMAPEPKELHVQGESVQAYEVSDGSIYVKLTPGKRNYFLYTPTVAGTFRFSVEDQNAVIGYYGMPHFVQEESVAEVVDNAFSESIRATMINESGTGTTVMVIGIDAGEGVDSCVLNIQRTGDPAWSVEDEPWVVYQPTAALAPYTTGAGVIRDFDLTAASDAYRLVLNEADGFYHLNDADGPLVLMYLTMDPPAYLPCFKNILERSGVSRYFFDDQGEFVKKETYDQCLIAYFDYADEANGLYPLTEDLLYILQQRGIQSGWWNPDSPGYLFVNSSYEPVPGINNEIAYLFMCCYLQ